MRDLYKQIGRKIRELRRQYGGRGISQEALAEETGTTANTISRWETGIYKPAIKDLHDLAKFFGVGISVFFPDKKDSRLQALVSATGDLGNADIAELTQYARFRKARRTLEHGQRRKKR
jgi:transcriptional regulator with XRE-family HTH domain